MGAVHSRVELWQDARGVRIRPYRTLENVIEGAVITFTEITEVKKARMALQESEALRQLAVVVRDSHDPVLVLALDGRIMAWNPCAVKTYGWTEAEGLTMNIRALIPANQRQMALAQLYDVAHSEDLAPFRAQRLAKDGPLIELWLTASALVDEFGELYAIATTGRVIGRGKP